MPMAAKITIQSVANPFIVEGLEPDDVELDVVVVEVDVIVVDVVVVVVDEGGIATTTLSQFEGAELPDPLTATIA